jgi:hypothetical protein
LGGNGVGGRKRKRPGNRLARRALLNGLLLGGVAGGIPWTPARGAADAPTGADAAKMTAADIKRIAAVLYSISLPADDADAIAKVADGALANLHYLTLLKSEDVQPPFGYAALVDEAERP